MIASETPKSKTTVITGGDQGPGKATAKKRHAAGANIAVTWFHDADGLNQSLNNRA